MTPTFREDPERTCLASIAMAFAPACDTPRDRALCQVGIRALVEAFRADEFSKHDAVGHINRHGTLPELRGRVGTRIFEMLEESGIVEKVSSNRYRITPSTLKKAESDTSKVASLVLKIVRDLLSDIGLPADRLKTILLRSLAETMAQYGHYYASQAISKSGRSPYVDHDALLAICTSVIDDEALAGQLPADRLTDAIAELFAMREDHFARLVYFLAGNYYYLRLLGLDDGLRYLSAKQFRGSDFFLDTNILLAFLFPKSRHHRSVEELSGLRKQLGITLCVSDVTWDEYRGLLHANQTQLAKTYDEVPDDLVEETSSDFLRAYRTGKAARSGLTLDEFFAKLYDAPKSVEQQWNIERKDDAIEERVSSEERDRARSVFDSSSRAVRNRPKSTWTLDHDVHLYFVVMEARKRGGETSAWFLTLDTSLPAAANRLQQDDENAFCMTLDGFLQIISPYVHADHQQTFANMFLEVVSRSVFVPEEIIRLDDFRMFTDIDLHIRALPGPDVKKIIRTVKKSLGGSSIGEAELKQVAYEVQKAFSDPMLGHKVAFEERLAELKAALKSRGKQLSNKDELFESLERRRQAEVAEIRAEMAQRVGGVKAILRGVQESLKSSKDEATATREQRALLLLIVRGLVAVIIGVPIVFFLWLNVGGFLAVMKSPLLCQVLGTIAIAGFAIGFVVWRKVASIWSLVLAFLALTVGVITGLMVP